MGTSFVGWFEVQRPGATARRSFDTSKLLPQLSSIEMVLILQSLKGILDGRNDLHSGYGYLFSQLKKASRRKEAARGTLG
jgi:hypothetical protein